MRKKDFALIDAARTENLNGIRTALAAAADVHAVGDSALYWSASYGHVEAIRLLLAAGADINANDGTALRVAAANGHVEAVRCLLAAGANLHAEGDIALRWAAYENHVEIVRVLLVSGADPVVAWSAKGSSVHRNDRTRMIKAFDACADAMTPEQRAALAKKSKRWLQLQIIVESEQKRRTLRR